MRKGKFIIFLNLIFLILGCSKETPNFRLSSFETPIITGYFIRDENGNLVGTVGNPNVKLGSESNDFFNSEYFLGLAPNPCNRYCSIYFKAPAADSIKKFWITKAEFNDGSKNSSINLGANNLNIGSSPLWQFEITSDNIALDLSRFDKGYYRIYVKMNDIILYDNLVIN